MPQTASNKPVSGKKQVKKTQKKKVQKKRVRNVQPFNGEKATVIRKELWKTINLTADTPVADRVRFLYGNFPAWFDKLATCYEHYNVRKLKFTLESSFAHTTSGNMVLSYNTVYSDTTVTDRAKLLAQKNAASFKVADQKTSVDVPKQALQMTPSRKTCRFSGVGLDTSYLIDACYQGSSSETGPVYLYVEYIVDFYTPQLN